MKAVSRRRPFPDEGLLPSVQEPHDRNLAGSCVPCWLIEAYSIMVSHGNGHVSIESFPGLCLRLIKQQQVVQRLDNTTAFYNDKTMARHVDLESNLSRSKAWMAPGCAETLPH
eukprot:TRINITY_DN6266_c0_g1_i1.p2 TRINITY_DN6266_c0_g1~~TRINITY_DN6266_c0_g1_i1.p2  ORF type:complete len:113 (-),score=4.28 TRINITY_DN6266_c0_g1_i1:207-545(-)